MKDGNFEIGDKVRFVDNELIDMLDRDTRKLVQDLLAKQEEKI